MSDNNNINEGCSLSRFRKNNYFTGKLMSVEDFQAEQQYMDGKRHLLNRLTSGPGIVCGLNAHYFTLTEENGIITIMFRKDSNGGGGVAIDGCGNEIVVPDGCEREFQLPSTGEKKDSTLYLYLEYKQYPDPDETVEAVTGQSNCETICVENRIVEDFEVIAKNEPPADPDAVLIVTESFKDEVNDRVTRRCPGTDDPEVFLAAVDVKKKKVLKINYDETLKYRSYVYNNQLLADIINYLIVSGQTQISGLYHVEEIDFKGENISQSKCFDHNFLRIPNVDVFQEAKETLEQFEIDTGDLNNIEEVFFFLKKTEAEIIAELVNRDKEDLDDWAIPLKEFKKKYDREIGEIHLDRDIHVLNPDKFTNYLNKLKIKNEEHFKVDATRRLKDLVYTTYGQLKKSAYCVFVKRRTGVTSKSWKKNPNIVEVFVNKTKAKVIYKKGIKCKILVVLTA